ncbi:HAMP domain-containing sensor histidine kinase [Luedemannella helvata]|uniref:histidine kinase n=1 Tax=Luedemannella helvata TaxID=349315 RepID=A0ABN2JX76_9ACTN
MRAGRGLVVPDGQALGGSWVEPERAVIRRARVRVSVLVGSVITLLVTAVGAIAYAVLVDSQDGQISRELEISATFGELAAPPVCTWVFAMDGGVVAGAPVPSPAGFPLRADLDQVSASGATIERTLVRNGTQYRVRTQARSDGRTYQAVIDMRYQLADRGYLLRALALAEAMGLFVAGLTGVFVGRRAVAPLAEALAKERRFVADASHELRTPITQAYTRLQVLGRLAERDELADEHRDGLNRLGGTLRRLSEIVDDLLLSARLAASPTARDGPPLNLVTLAEAAVAAEADRAAERQLTLTVDRPGDPLFVQGVDSALRRAIGELLANAIGHTPPGGRIRLALRRVAPGQVELSVTDTGHGFDPADAEWIFSRFRHGPRGEGHRYGLGLALTREVVTSHGGTIEAVGAPGQGAQFTIRLPESRASRPRRSRPGAPEPAP